MKELVIPKIGGDESNHGGRKRYHPIGIYVVTLSLDPDDAQVKELPAERNYELAYEWLTQGGKSKGRDFRFGLVYNRHSDPSYHAPRISEVTAKLARPMLTRIRTRNRIGGIEIHLDGELVKGEIEGLKKDFAGIPLERVVGHPKTMCGGQVVNHPKLVDIADNIASEIFLLLRLTYRGAMEIYESERRVDIVGNKQNEDMLRAYLNKLKRRKTIRQTL